LLEEEATEKGNNHWDPFANNQNQDSNMMPMGTGMQGLPMGGGPGGYDGRGYAPQPMGMAHVDMTPMHQQVFRLPTALVTQYPALANFDWNAVPSGPDADMEGDVGGRSSFDMSDRGEDFGGDEGDYREAYGWASDFEGR